MRNIGMIVAVEIEAVLKEYGEPIRVIEESGYLIYQYKLDDNNLYVIHSGAGEIAAAMTTQFLITKLNTDLIVNFGVAGGLNGKMKLSKTCIVEKIVHYDFDTSEADNCEPCRYLDYPSIFIPTTKELVKKATTIIPTLSSVICASGDKFIADENKKIELNKLYNADICEMEAAGIVLTCNKNDVPCILIKTVSDAVSGGVEEFKKSFDESARICIDITNQIVSNI